MNLQTQDCEDEEGLTIVVVEEQSSENNSADEQALCSARTHISNKPSQISSNRSSKLEPSQFLAHHQHLTACAI